MLSGVGVARQSRPVAEAAKVSELQTKGDLAGSIAAEV